jgi:hypothetical protein
MTEDAVPEADAWEQRRPLLDPDAPEQDAPTIGDETPEADAIEQSIPVPLDEEDEPR